MSGPGGMGGRHVPYWLPSQPARQHYRGRLSMSSAAKAKGTKWERELLADLRDIYGEQVKRSAPGTQSCDFYGTDQVRIEAKSWRVPRIPLWVRAIRKVATSAEWAILWTGDRRVAYNSPVMVVDLEFGKLLLKGWKWYREDLVLAQKAREALGPAE